MKALLLALLASLAFAASAQDNAAPLVEVDTEAQPPSGDVELDAGDVVAVGHDAKLGAGDKANSVVAVLGSASSAGEVFEAVVSVLGSTHVTGPVQDAVVAVLGNVYVDSAIGGDAVAVLGNVDLGPRAVIGGDVVSIGGQVKRNPAAVVHGDVQNVMVAPGIDLQAFHPWIRHCLMLGRPLALAPGLEWAWFLAAGFLALYILLAALFRGSVDRCVQTLEDHPGRSVLAAFLALLLTPVLFVLLFITIIGIALVPFVGFALFIAGLFGKAVMLAWIGKRVLHFAPQAHIAAAVLVGGLIVLGLYLIPFVGFIVYKLLGVLGLGVVVYTLVLIGQRNRSLQPATTISAAASPAPATETAVAVEPVELAPAAAPASEPPVATRAGFRIRMGALLLDIILIGIILALLHDIGKIEILVLAIYGALMWKLKGSTIGGIICGLKVVRLDGRPVDWPTAIVRALGCFLSLAVAGLGFFWIAFDNGKQAWHDKIAGTVVVRAPKGHSLV